MDDVVTLFESGARPLVAYRCRQDCDRPPTVIPRDLGVVWTFVRRDPAIRPGRNVVAYWSDGVVGECGVEVDRPASSGDPEVVPSEIPAGTFARAVHVGPYSGLGAAHSAVRRWCAANGVALAGPFWEVYGHWVDDQTEPRTDVEYLVRPADGAAGTPSPSPDH